MEIFPQTLERKNTKRKVFKRQQQIPVESDRYFTLFPRGCSNYGGGEGTGTDLFEGATSAECCHGGERKLQPNNQMLLLQLSISRFKITDRVVHLAFLEIK